MLRVKDDQLVLKRLGPFQEHKARQVVADSVEITNLINKLNFGIVITDSYLKSLSGIDVFGNPIKPDPGHDYSANL